MADLTVEGRVQRIEQALWIGNGKPPMADEVRKQGAKLDGLKTDVADLKKSVDAVLGERQSEKDRRAGRWEVAGWVKWVAAFVAAAVPILGTLAYTQVIETLGRIASVVNSLPPLP